MNEKELKNLEHYRRLIENRKFDEYDIIGFLILIREYIVEKNNPIFFDIANGTAHRERNRGIIYESIYKANLNNYSLDKNNHVENYKGINDNDWKKECENISMQFNIKITPIIAVELAVCMFSIIHRSKFITNKKSLKNVVQINGSIEMRTGQNELYIITSDDIEKLSVCFMIIKNVKILKKDIFIMDVVDTYRKNKFLYLRMNNENILKVTKRK